MLPPPLLRPAPLEAQRPLGKLLWVVGREVQPGPCAKGARDLQEAGGLNEEKRREV